MADKIRVGVVGAGAIGTVHVNSWKQVPGAEVVALSEINEERAAARAKALGVPSWFGDYREMVCLAEIDAVDVCTPNYLHCPVAVAALSAGKHVICEKPMAMNKAEGLKMVAAAKKAKRTLMMAFCMRYRGDSQAAKKLVDAGELGNIYHIRVITMRRRGIPGLGGWFTRIEQGGGGPLLDIGVHLLDLSLWLAGFPQPKSACASKYTEFGDRKDYTYLGMWGTPEPGGPFTVEDLVSGFVRFKNGMSLTLEAAWAANVAGESFIDLMGDKGGIRLALGETLALYAQRNGQLVDVKPLFRNPDAYLEEVKHFAECIRTGKTPMSPGEDGVKVQTVIDGLYRSAEAGKEVNI
jgi:predicted dehydrogenase